MLAHVCLLALIGLGSCSEIEKIMPSRDEIENSINRTIEEVEKMIRDNPSLPKLSRNDIVNILYNITSKDVGSMEDEALKAIQRTREDYQRALMVVLPYKPDNTGESLKELYTKPPMVQIIPDNEFVTKKDSKIEVAYNSSQYSKNNAQQSDNVIDNKHQWLTAHMTFDDTEKSKTSNEINLENSRTTVIPTTTTTTTTTTKPTTNKLKIDSEPQKFTFNLNSPDLKADASHTSIATKRPIYKGTFSRYRTSTRTPPKLEIIYSTTEKTTTTTTTESKIETTTLPTKSKQNILSSDQWHYNAPPVTTTHKTMDVNDLPWKPMAPKDYFLPTVQTSPDNLGEPNFSDVKNEDFEQIMKVITTTQSAPIFVTPSVTSNKKRVNSNSKIIPSGFKLPTTTTASSTTMREEVEQLLKTIGLEPMKSDKYKNNFKSNQNSGEIPKYTSIKQSDIESVITDLSNKKTNNSFAATQINIKNLSPDIQLLFQRFGLQIPEKENMPTITTTTTTTTSKPTIPSSVNSYTHFKPLPTSSVRDKDFRNFLARFGLGTGENRNQKAMQSKPTKRPSLIEAVPSNMRKILENIGLIKKTPKIQTDVNQESNIKIDTSKIEEQTTSFNEHIFKPSEITVSTGDQKEKIKSLLNTVRMVQEGKANVQDVQKIAHDLLQSTKTLENGPDPLKLEEILNNYRNSLKNEVKREEEQTTTTTEAATSTSKEPTTSSTSSSVSPTTQKDTKLIAADQPPSASTKEEKTEKPSFFDTFDISSYLNKTNNSSDDTTKGPSTTKISGSFFDNFNVDDYTTTEGAVKNTNLGDLEASFGGSTAAPDPVIPTRPKTGLYFLLDWNSFLEVGEPGKEHVNIRFAPKVGDRTRFIPVKIP